ncbi:hypothetical protein Misp04_20250 [Micromonospora sp. NBRC 101691]|nr:hypothetical protein Misp04_20250 [Micromonospora sp. NBRC 101691]
MISILAVSSDADMDDILEAHVTAHLSPATAGHPRPHQQAPTGHPAPASAFHGRRSAPGRRPVPGLGTRAGATGPPARRPRRSDQFPSGGGKLRAGHTQRPGSSITWSTKTVSPKATTARYAAVSAWLGRRVKYHPQTITGVSARIGKDRQDVHPDRLRLSP